jgi:hypothetical protein
MSDYETWLVIKFFLIVGGVGLAAFFYRLFTGKRLADKFQQPPDQS